MIIKFTIEYYTNWGEDIRITGSTFSLGDNEISRAYPLSTIDGKVWSGSIEINESESNPDLIFYNYCLFKEGRPTQKEWDYFPRTIQLSTDKNEVVIYNKWRNKPNKQYLYSSAFTNCFFSRKENTFLNHDIHNSLLIKTICPNIPSDYTLAISGNQEELGNWNPDRLKFLNSADFPEWKVELNSNSYSFPIEYKYVLYNLKENRIEKWEDSVNHTITIDKEINGNLLTTIDDGFIQFETPDIKFAGVAIPVFSLRTEKSFGIGDFGDLKKMIEWAVQTDQKIVQLLPINDTTMNHTWTDSYPYNSISIYALHPIYANLSAMGTIQEIEKAAYFAEQQKILNSSPTLQYEEVNRIKWEYFRQIYKQEGKSVLASEDFKVFFGENKEWLQPYAVFSYLRDLYKTPDFRLWPKYTAYERSETEELTSPENAAYEEIAIFYYIQYHLHIQLQAASTYARQNGVVLKGDIPIGISRTSVEAWVEPHYFNLNGQAGAPPDDFAINGQNWGFPTYNWDVMEKDNYQWWRKRFMKLAEYFDAYRIDHILGFMRIWEIPISAVYGLLGQFSPALPLTKEEIESFGLEFIPELFTRPYIHEQLLLPLFGDQTQVVKETFLAPASLDGVYEIREEFNTQRKVEAYFIDKTDFQSVQIREGLYTLLSDVLFLVDHRDPEKYHPRISGKTTFIYQTLSEAHKKAFDNLYEDFYYHRHNHFWYEQAMKKLPELTHSNKMLVCGEDLGMIPASLKDVMNDLQILSLEIQRMPKEAGVEFGDPGHYPLCSVATISTHDMSTLRGWWKEDANRTQRYFNTILHHDGIAPENADEQICKEVIAQHLNGNSLLCILAWQDWLSMDEKWRNPDIQIERINVPADSRHYWRYRMHLTLEEQIQAESINDKIKELIRQTGRKN